MDFMDQFAVENEPSATTVNDDQVNDDLIENENNKNFIDDSTEIEGVQRVSDYFPQRNITRLISDAEEDAFTQFDVDDFLDFRVEADNYLSESFDSNKYDSDVDDFDGFKKRIEKCKEELQIPHPKVDKDSFFNAVCYAIRYSLTQNKTPCD